MSSLKQFFRDINASGEANDAEDLSIEVYADSIQQALELAAEEFNTDVSMLDYSIIDKGSGGILGIGRQPYHLLVNCIKSEPAPDLDIDVLSDKLSHKEEDTDRHSEDAAYKIRVTRSGIWFTAIKPKGSGQPLNLEEIKSRFAMMHIDKFNSDMLEKAVKKMSGKPVRLGDASADTSYDGTISIKISEDDMKAYAMFTSPRFYGCHLEYDEVVDELKNAGVVFGIKEREINDYLENMDYSRPLLAAEGQKPVPGDDAYIDYKVNINKGFTQFEEDENGRVDFHRLGLVENVTAGQLLAVKVQAAAGIEGRTVRNQVLPVKPAKDISIQYGKGTILSADKLRLTAEINGQVVYQHGVISVEPVYRISGDVGLETGNIEFLGTVIVSGNVHDNFSIHAGGNIEIKGTSERATLEAGGDIIAHQGIVGSQTSYIKSTGGNIYAKFIQNATVSADNDIIVPEGIMHCNADAGNRVLCNGRRAKIVGGLIRAENEVNARFIGGEGSAKTEVKVGIAPNVFQSIAELTQQQEENKDELEKVKKELLTLTRQRASSKLSEEKEKLFEEFTERNEKLEEAKIEIEEMLHEQQGILDSAVPKGKVCIQDTVYPGVSIFVAGAPKPFNVQDDYHLIKFYASNGEITLSEYEEPEIAEGEQKIRTLAPRSRRR